MNGPRRSDAPGNEHWIKYHGWNGGAGSASVGSPCVRLHDGAFRQHLLLRYLNCSKDLVVWGEHAAILTDLAVCYAKLTKPTTQAFVDAARPWVDSLLRKNAVVCSSDKMTIEWVNSFSATTIRDSFRSFLFSLLNQRIPREVRWGFKEIHYGRSEMNLLRQLFEGSRFLLLVRNPADIIRSKFTWFAMRDAARMRPHFEETLHFFEFAHDEVNARSRDTLLVHYDALMKSPATEMSRIAGFIGTAMLEDQLQAIIGERRVAPASRPERQADLHAELHRMQVVVEESKVEQLAALHRVLVERRAEAADSAGASPPTPAIESPSAVSAAA